MTQYKCPCQNCLSFQQLLKPGISNLRLNNACNILFQIDNIDNSDSLFMNTEFHIIIVWKCWSFRTISTDPEKTIYTVLFEVEIFECSLYFAKFLYLQLPAFVFYADRFVLMQSEQHFFPS